METLKQAATVLMMNVRALRQRMGTSVVIVIGIAGVAAVLISVLAMATGLVETLHASARDDRVVVVRNGASDETSSMLSRADTASAMDAPGVKHDAAGRPIASAEALVVATFPLAAAEGEADVSIRGVGANAAALRPEIHVTAGRTFRPGVKEVIVGRKAASLFRDLQVGAHPIIGGSPWTVVGTFASGSALDSTLLTDVETLMSAFSKEYQSVTVQLESAQALQGYRDALKLGSLPVEVFSEREFFERQSTTLNTALKILAYVVGGIMAFGAIVAALNIMYSAVSTRAVEIATLRAIGYGPDAMIIAVLVETLALALIGGVVGALLSWLVFNGYELSTIAGGGAQLAFELAVTPGIIIIGIAWACAIGLLGGLLPALQAARLPVVVALHSA